MQKDSISGHSSVAELERTATGIRRRPVRPSIDERVCDKRVGSISRGIGVDEERIVGALSGVLEANGKTGTQVGEDGRVKVLVFRGHLNHARNVELRVGDKRGLGKVFRRSEKGR